MRIGFGSYFNKRRKDRAFTVILTVFLLFCLSSAVFWSINFNLGNILLSLSLTLTVPAFFATEYLLGLRFGEIFTFGILFIAAGSILGSCYDLYTVFPRLDTLLHGTSGVLFAALGFALAQKLFDANDGRMLGCLLFAIFFSLSLAVFWELFEYTCTSVFGMDMMEDCYITEINSHLLAGTHSDLIRLEEITKTVVYYADKKMYTIQGYLDIGLTDTLTDLGVCTVGAVLFAIFVAITIKRAPRLLKLLIPKRT